MCVYTQVPNEYSWKRSEKILVVIWLNVYIIIWSIIARDLEEMFILVHVYVSTRVQHEAELSALWTSKPNPTCYISSAIYMYMYLSIYVHTHTHTYALTQMLIAGANKLMDRKAITEGLPKAVIEERMVR